jgi:hypothetical protein
MISSELCFSRRLRIVYWVLKPMYVCIVNALNNEHYTTEISAPGYQQELMCPHQLMHATHWVLLLVRSTFEHVFSIPKLINPLAPNSVASWAPKWAHADCWWAFPGHAHHVLSIFQLVNTIQQTFLFKRTSINLCSVLLLRRTTQQVLLVMRTTFSKFFNWRITQSSCTLASTHLPTSTHAHYSLSSSAPALFTHTVYS